MAITWSSQTENCDTGSEETFSSNSWTNPSYAWDENNSNSATISLSKYNISNFLSGTFSGSITGSGTVGRVQLGVKCEGSNVENLGFYIFVSDVSDPEDANNFYLQISGIDLLTSDDTEEDLLFDLDLYNITYNRTMLEDLYFSVAVANNNTTTETASINQIYCKIEYTNDLVTRTDLELTYDTGTSNSSIPYDDIDWTNTSNAFNGTKTSYASVTVDPTNIYSYWLEATAHDNSISSGDIKGVSVALYGYSSNEDNSSEFEVDDGVSNYNIPYPYFTTTATSVFFNVAFYLPMSGWTWTKINNTDLSVGVEEDGTSTIYVGEFYLGVTYFVEDPTKAFKYRKGGVTTECALYNKYGGQVNIDLESDAFDDNSFDTGIWSTSGSGGTYTLNEQNDRLELTCSSNDDVSTIYLDQSTTDVFDVSIKINSYSVSSSLATTHFIAFILGLDNDGADGAFVFLSNFYDGEPSTSWYLNSGDATLNITPPSTPFWMRLQIISSSEAYTYYSTDGDSWTEMEHFTGQDFGTISGMSFGCMSQYISTNNTITVYANDFVNRDNPDDAWNKVFATRVDGENWYGQLDSNTSHTNASDLRMRVDGDTYVLLTEQGTPTEDLDTETLEGNIDVVSTIANATLTHVPSTSYWESIHDTTYWKIHTGTPVGSWDSGNSEWDSGDYASTYEAVFTELADGATWQEGFFPTKVRFTFDDGSGAAISLWDDTSIIAGQESTPTIVSGEELDITYNGSTSADEITAFNFLKVDGDTFSITNIEFFI